MSSNIKPKPSAKESPTEPFKRAVAGCMRALSRKPDLEISYAAERPGMAGGKARLPEPPRKLSPQDAAIVRGHADSIALRLACHDPAVHRRQLPSGQQGRAVFEAVEQARVEAIGARRMHGVAQNLGAMLDDKFHRGKFDDITDRADAPIEDAVAMMVRERLTGAAAAAGCAKTGRSVAAVHRGARRQGARPAGAAGREPAPLRRRDPRPARLARDGRRARARLGGRRPGRFRRQRQAAEPGRGRREPGVRTTRRA